MIEAPSARHEVLFKDAFSYCAHPHTVRTANGDLLVVFNCAPRRPFILHPPEDPLYRNVMMRSSDDGETWSEPEVVPGYDWSGTECAGLTTLRNGAVLLNQWRFHWLPLGLAKRLKSSQQLAFPDTFMRGWLASPEHDTGPYQGIAPERLAPWARGGGETWVHLSDDDGRSFPRSVRIDTTPFSGGYGMRGACELANGDILLPLSDVPNWEVVFTVRSRDGGLTWDKPAKCAEQPGSQFEEPSLVETAPGRLLMVLRDNGSRYLHIVTSGDSGQSWSTPRRLPVEGYPAHLLPLSDGRLLLTYGWRRPDYGIRAVYSSDNGATWDIQNTVRIRGGMPNRNLGYPVAVPTRDGQMLAIYYGECGDGVTSILGTWWRMPA